MRPFWQSACAVVSQLRSMDLGVSICKNKQRQEIGDQSNARAYERPGARGMGALATSICPSIWWSWCFQEPSLCSVGWGLQWVAQFHLLSVPLLGPWVGLREKPPEGMSPGDANIKKGNKTSLPFTSGVLGCSLHNCSCPGLRRAHAWFNALLSLSWIPESRHISFETNWRSGATLRWASLLAQFFQQPLLALCLCVILQSFPQYFKLFH